MIQPAENDDDCQGLADRRASVVRRAHVILVVISLGLALGLLGLQIGLNERQLAQHKVQVELWQAQHNYRPPGFALPPMPPPPTPVPWVPLFLPVLLGPL